jgi:hypothetical protein
LLRDHFEPVATFVATLAQFGCLVNGFVLLQ